MKEIKTNYKAKRKELKRDYKQKMKIVKEEYRSNLETYRLENINPNIINPPKRGVLEEIGNAVTHGIGSIFAIIALILMLKYSNTNTKILSTIIYFFGLFIMFTMSCLYHSFRYGSCVKRIFRRFDYSSIYLLIGATFVPLLLVYIGGTFGIIFFIIQWIIIITGVTLIGVFGPGKIRPLHITLYIVLGWSGLIIIPQMIKNDISLFYYILGGGLIYTIGIIPFALKKKAAHFIWHFFVLLGAIVQWIGIFLYVYH